MFCRRQPDWDHCVLNLDDIARAMGDADARAVRDRAWTLLLATLRRRMDAGQPVLCVDTVFGQREFEQVAALCGDYGYETALWVFSPSGPDVCAGRIAERRDTGGHGRPELAGELFESSLSAASEASLDCDYTFLIDTSGPLRLAAWLQGVHTMDVYPNLPQWVTEYFPVYPGESREATPEEDLARIPSSSSCAGMDPG